MPEQTILIAITGLSPAILSETIWALAQEEEPVLPDRILVVTTTIGRDCLRQTFFTHDTWNILQEQLARVTGSDLSGKLRFGPISDCIRVVPHPSLQKELEDIRTPAENEAVADYLMSTLRSFSEDSDWRIIASLAGGRKTMGALLLSVMSLVGRAQDRVVHVLVDDPWDKIPHFLYPGCPGTFLHPNTGLPLDSRDARLSLADVPFVPLRYLFEKELRRADRSYLRLTNDLRQRALNLNVEIHLSLTPLNANFQVNGQTISLSSMEYAFLLYFADRLHRGAGPLSSYKDLPLEEIQSLVSRHTPARETLHWTRDALAKLPSIESDDWRKIRHSLKEKLRKAGLDNYQTEQVLPVSGRLSINLSPADVTIL